MFHKATELKFKKGTTLEITFQDGEVKEYNMARLFRKYPQLKALKDRQLFLQGKLMGAYGIVWNDDLDIETETIYEDGVTIRKVVPAIIGMANAVGSARARTGMSQRELAEKSGIDQSDISKIERGVSNPSIQTLNRLAEAMGMELKLEFT